MFNFRLFFHLFLRSFSLSGKSLRYPGVKRILVIFIGLPLYLLLLLVNRFFMLLDYLFFTGFRKTEVNRAAFITGIPRSATTFVLTNLARDREHFTCFKFWELMFAPSVIQKYFWVMVSRIDRRMGSPVKRFSGWIDQIMFGSFRGIHDIGLTKPEEDEVIFMYTFTSAYLSYFFPGLDATDKYLLFDDEVSQSEKARLMAFYYRFVQRHNYVFNRNGEKYFISKNPSFVSKLESLLDIFPGARVVYLLRTPYRTIPATISLNAHIYAATCRLPEPYPLVEKTREMLARWYIMADRAMKSKVKDQGITLYFKNVTLNPKRSMLELYNFLDIEPNGETIKALEFEEKQSKSYRSPHKYDERVGIDPDWIEERLGFLFTGDIRQKI